MEKKNILKIEDILKRKDFFKNKKNETKELHIKSLDCNIVIKKADATLCYECMDMEDNEEANKFFVYETVSEPNLKDTKLHEEFGCITPLDIVYEIFEPGEVAGIATEGMKFAGFHGGVEEIEALKN